MSDIISDSPIDINIVSDSSIEGGPTLSAPEIDLHLPTSSSGAILVENQNYAVSGSSLLISSPELSHIDFLLSAIFVFVVLQFVMTIFVRFRRSGG